MAKKTICAICFALWANLSGVSAQTQKHSQFWNEYAFSKDLSQNWVAELDAGLTTSSLPEESSPFYEVTQYYLRAWIHYYPHDRWKLAFFYAYYVNEQVPELNQTKANEYRFALQATYNVMKRRITLNTRFRFEDRNIQNDSSVFESVERFRMQIKATYPINKKKITDNTLYGFASDELFFKTKSDISGPDLFDRNRLTLGCGYAFTKDWQLEISYVNEILPRDNGDRIYNALQVNVIFTNLLPNLVNSFKRKEKAVDDGGGT